MAISEEKLAEIMARQRAKGVSVEPQATAMRRRKKYAQERENLGQAAINRKTLDAKYGRNKFGAKAVRDCAWCHQSHGSQVEAARCAYLHQAEGIAHIDAHPTVSLSCGRWTPDFMVWTAEGTAFVEEVKRDSKGRKNPTCDTAFRRARNSFNAEHPCAPLHLVFGRKLADGSWAWRHAESDTTT